MFSVGDRVRLNAKLMRNLGSSARHFPSCGTIIKDDGSNSRIGRFHVLFDQTTWPANPSRISAGGLELAEDEPIIEEDWS